MVLLGSTRGLVEHFDPYADVHRKGITLIGAHISSHPSEATHFNRWTHENNRRLALDLIADGSLQVEPLISHVLPLEETERAFRMVADRQGLKLMVVMPDPA